MRKYLFIAANPWIGWAGSEFLWSGAAEKLARRGHEVRVSVKDWSQPIAGIERLRPAGCKLHYRRSPSLLSRLGRKMFPLPEYEKSHVRAIGKDVDLTVISQGLNSDGLVWMEAAKSAGYRYAVIAQGAAEQWWPDDDAADRQAASYEGAIRAYFVSQANVNLSRRQFGTPLQNAKVVRNPFNVRYDAQPPWPTESNWLSLACVAQLDVGHKGQDLLLEVLSLEHWRERKVRVSLFGSGPNERLLRRIAGQLKLPNVEFAGYSHDIEEVWSRHHALTLPSRLEGMPLAVVEA